MHTYNLSPTKENYYRQNNNLISPSITCKPTATIEALALAGWPFPQGEYPQPEDNLTALCRTGEAQTVMLNIDPSLRGTMPNELWEVIAWAINERWYPTYRPLIGPRYNWALKDVLQGIVDGIPFATSTWLTQGGHVVNIVGFETDQDISRGVRVEMARVKTIIIDDPYGDRTSGKYDITKSGWNNRYPIVDFWKLWRGIGVQIRPKGRG